MKGYGPASGLRRRLGAAAIFNGRPINWPRAGSPLTWAAGLAVLAAAILIKLALESVIGGALPPYITLSPAVVVAALLGGPRVGMVIGFVAVITASLIFLPVYYTFQPGSAVTLLSVGLYLVISPFVGWIIGRARLAIDAAAENEERRHRAARESVHRIKNLIAIVQALASKIARENSSVEDFRSVLSSRLAALATAQDVLVQSGWSDVDLNQIVDNAMAPFLPNPGLEVVRGDPLRVPARHVGGLSMALYELCTNSLKYGALAEGQGPVRLSWRRQEGDAVLEWTEQTPEPVTPVEGLGTQLVRYALGKDADTSVDYRIDGVFVRAMFRWPVS